MPLNDPSPPRGGAPSQPSRRNNGNGHRNDDLISPSDMESLLRQWGATTSSSGLSNVEGEVFGGNLPMDRSASFDNNEPMTNRANNNNINYLAPNNNEHRRIASAGNDRMSLSSSSSLVDFASALVLPPPQPQAVLFDGRGQGAEVEAAAAAASSSHLTDNMDGSDNNNMILLHHGMSALHDAARITDWRSVMALSISNPESAKYVGPDGWNALHHACDRRCPHVDVIDALLTAYPEAIIQTNDKGWTPLHRACRNKTPKDVVKLLLRKYPELGKRAAAMRCNDGRSSLHYALLYQAPEGVVDLLLQADPGAVLEEDRDGLSPLGTVWDKYANSFEGKRMLHMLLRPFEGEGWELGGGRTNDNMADDRVDEDAVSRRSVKLVADVRVREAMEKSAPSFKILQNNWKQVHTLLRAYFHFPLQEVKVDDNDNDATMAGGGQEGVVSKRRKWRILHATSAIKCHPSLFTLARALHPEEALEVDENDLFGAGHVLLHSTNDPQPTQEFSNRTALHFAAMSPLAGRDGRNVIKVLLKLNPLAANQADGYGSLPLHLICQNIRKLHWTNDGAKDIYTAFPEAATSRDGFGRNPLHCISFSFGQYTHTASANGNHFHNHTYAGLTAETIAPLVADVAPDESIIQKLVEANGTAASMPDNSGRLPLHYIAELFGEWTPDAQSILDAHPAAVQTRSGTSTNNQLPLHMAASSPDARPSLILSILNSNPRAASLVDGMGRLPLHLAVDSGRTTWDRGMDIIYSAYTPALTTPEESTRRWTVLHAAAASRSAGCELIENIIHLAANLASIPDGDGKYPLHLACTTNRSWTEGGIQAIFDADPSVALLEDAYGLLPFHTAALSSTETQEDAASVDTTYDDILSLEVLFNLLIAQPSILVQR